MKAAFIDCSSGISGDMMRGALIDAGLPLNYLKAELKKLHILDSGYRLSIFDIRSPTKATRLTVSLLGRENHRNLKEILQIISKSKLSTRVKRLSSRIFIRLAEAEAKVHGININDVHFHEVGATDAIIDIVGSAIGLDYFGVEEVFCSPVNVGSGTINHSHGRLPIPAPATAELLKGIPIYDSGIKKELATPTGAAILSTIVKSFGQMPRIIPSYIGSGAGGYSLKIQPNFLRIIIGKKEIETEKDSVLLIETNIDDMNPKLYDKAIAIAMKAGALDAYFEPIRMKKQRNAVKFSVICTVGSKDRVLEAVFTATTSLGVRIYLVQREKISRSFYTKNTKYGKVQIKIGKLGKKTMTIAPEYEDYKKLAEKHKIPISRPYRNAFKEY